VRNQKNSLKPIDTPVYSYWSALYLSFFSRRLFVDVGKRWKGFSIGYLLLVIALLSIPFSLTICFSFNKFFNEQLINPLLQLPTIYVQNGEASINKPMPYLIKNKAKQVVLIVDTSGVINGFSNKYPYLNILINKNKMSYRIPTPQLFNGIQQEQNSRIPIEQYYSKEVNSVFNGESLVESGGIKKLKYVSQLMIYPIVIGVLFGFFVIIYPVVALLAQVFSRVFFSFQITYLQACRLIIVSSTPMLLVLFLCLSLNWVFPGLGIILIAILATYYGNALSALKAESLQLVAP